MKTICPSCGVPDCLLKQHELSLYTLSLRDAFFSHQLIVDAYAASHARDNSKPVTNAFALIGLYLFAEKGYTGKQVQNVHKFLADRKKDWPLFAAPEQKAAITVADVLDVPAGEARGEKIKEWARAVWETFKNQTGKIEELLRPFDLQKHAF